MKKFNSILFHIPHSSLFIPNNNQFIETESANLSRSINLLTDFHTDKFFDFIEESKNTKKIIFEYNRFYLDVERFWDDDKEIMSKNGQGAIYTHDCFGNNIRNYNGKDYDFLKTIYSNYHNNLNNTTLDLIKNFDDCLLIDCHSFSEIIKPNSSDICLGFNDDFTKPKNKDINTIINILNDNGYSTSINYPYSGSMVPNNVFNNQKYNGKFYSLMFEVNKKIYLNNDNSINEIKFKKLQNTLEKILKIIMR